MKKEMKKIEAQARAMLILAVGGTLFLAVLGCAPMVRTDLKSLQANPAAYEGKSLILTTDIESLVRDPGMYENRRVELTGQVRNQISLDPSRWSFFLEDKDGHSVRCVEVKHRVGAWLWEEHIVRDAGMENEPLTVVGLYKGSEVHLNRIEYLGIPYDTDYPRNGSPGGFPSL